MSFFKYVNHNIPLIFTITFLICLTSVTAAGDKKLSSVWKLSFTGLSFDPTGWTDAVKEKVIMSAAGTAYVAFLGASLTICAVWFIFLYGFVSLNWAIVALTSACYYGYRRGGKLILAGAALLTYLYVFGAISV